MGNSKAVVEKIRRLRKEREYLMRDIEEAKKLADSEATALESEVSMLREELKIEEQEKLTDSEATDPESADSRGDEELRIEELKKLTASKTTALENEISMLRNDLRVLRMDVPPNEPKEPKEEADPKKKSWWHFFR